MFDTKDIFNVLAGPEFSDALPGVANHVVDHLRLNGVTPLSQLQLFLILEKQNRGHMTTGQSEGVSTSVCNGTFLCFYQVLLWTWFYIPDNHS